ncbi:MAG TPA: FtsX-like permease family protein, partial [Candidatus Limnocylindria bacterium]|nr:FtsX-like permease family protein [Candidatus Limnocylindria bacterium]
GLIYAGAVSEAGLRRTLHDAPVRDANVEITARVPADAAASTDQRIRQEIGTTFDAVGAKVVRVGESDSFQLPDGLGAADLTNLTTLAFYDEVAQHASLIAGEWPSQETSAASRTLPVAVSEPTAALLALNVGQQLSLVSRQDPSFGVPVAIVGIFRLTDPADPYWWDSQQLIDGVSELASYRTYGPMLVDPAAFFGHAVTSGALLHWYAFPAFDNVQIDGIATLRSWVGGLHDRLESTFGVSAQVGVRTRLDVILAAAERSLLVARTGVLILTVQLGVLAGYALLLTAGLLIEQRRVETALLRSRGASTSQVGSLALMEGLLLAVPAILLGPWLAAGALRLLNRAGPLADISLELDPQVSWAAYALAGIAGLACIVALVVPAVTSARSFIATRQSKGRQQARGIAQRAGLDLALLAVAGIGFWQLRHYGAPITASVQGQLGLDPFLVAAPAVGLLAGAVLALRLIPLLAQLVDHGVSRLRGLVSSLGAWQIARRPARYTRSALLLMLAIALGVFAVSYTETWTDSQLDQADYQVGADLAVAPDRRVGSALSEAVLAQAYGTVDGVGERMPLARQSIAISRTSGSGTLLALDASVAPQVVRLRPDLSAASFSQQMQQLVEHRPSVALFAIPGTPQRLRFDVTLHLAMSDPQLTTADAPAFEADAVIRDAAGLFHRVGAQRIEATTGRPQPVVIALGQTLPDGGAFSLQYPIELAAIELRASAHAGTPSTLYGVSSDSMFAISNVAVSASHDADEWSDLASAGPHAAWQFSVAQSGSSADAPDLRLPDALGMRLATNDNAQTTAPVIFAAQPATLGTPDAAPLPIIAGRAFLEAVAAKVGDETRIDIGPQRQPAVIAGQVDAFPTIDPATPLAIADLPTVSLLQYRLSGETTAPTAWWLDVDPAKARAAAAALEDAPFSSRAVISRIERGQALRTDPVALGVIGGLALGFVSAALFAAIGFVVSASVSARERLTEFALLRALGLSPGQLSGWLSIENGMLVLISLVGGTGLGLLMAWVALPFVTVTQDASKAVPPVIVAIPWASIVLLELITVVVLAVMVVVLALLLRRIGLGSALRLGDE